MKIKVDVKIKENYIITNLNVNTQTNKPFNMFLFLHKLLRN